eukprot:CAMPEP_0116013288 /NCGR_PEP_ID=MMETSP0321-20121206/5638_1 /TAXON_ID=163516 /ORGANISM="Leptocylindrus danicus var. danicus, Strain B650" /LENGTH=155 /DNA_ID=CAMNT_0003482811 /DNA_START=44 /DNA_END=511 /DNA_ORIENTATION=+
MPLDFVLPFERTTKALGEFRSFLELNVDGPTFGYMTLSKLSRIGEFTLEDEYCSGFSFKFKNIVISMPPSPQELGHKYTLSKFRETSGENDAQMFQDFSDKMWEDAASKPELSRFFKQTEEDASIKGKYFGKVCTDHSLYAHAVGRFFIRLWESN